MNNKFLSCLPFLCCLAFVDVSRGGIDVSTPTATDISVLGSTAPLSPPSWCEDSVAASTAPLWGEARYGRPVCVKGIHLTAWYMGHKPYRPELESLLADTELNTVVVAVKEINGEVYLPGLNWDPRVFTSTASALRPYRRAIPDLEQYLHYLKERGIFTIARITVFQDQIIPKLKPEWAVQSSSPLPKAIEKGFDEKVWVDQRGFAWLDPYNKRIQKYNIDIAVRAAQLGFQGIQFDYLRFPSDGSTELCRYSRPHSLRRGPKALAHFLRRARAKLRPFKVELSIDVFGLTGSHGTGMGIGQKLPELLKYVDVLSPMMYPSHYGAGELGLEDPNKAPYETVFRSVRDTIKQLEGTDVELRPFLQDFSLGVKYTAERVRAQIEAVGDNGLYEWLLWNPRCRYTRDALLPAKP